MNILQFQVTNTTEKELDIVDDFCYWLCDQIFEYINTKINRKKIQLRLNYLYQVPWIEWSNKKYIDTQSIMSAIYNSLMCEEHKNNTFVIKIDMNVTIPNTYTSIDRLIRFINYGDNKCKPTGIFTNLQHDFKHNRLNTLWKIYTTNRLGYISEAKIIAE